MVTMVQNGSQAMSSSVRDLGFTGQSASMDTSIIISTIARATTDLCQPAATIRGNTAQSSMAGRCMTHMDMRHHTAINSFGVSVDPQEYHVQFETLLVRSSDE